MHDTAPRALHVSRKEVRQKLEARIEKGQQLHDRPLLSYDELNKARMHANKWSQYNTHLLRRLFDSVAPINEYTPFYYQDSGDYAYSAHMPSLQDEVLGYQANIADSIYSLEGIHERVELYDEPLNESQRTSDNEESSDSPPPTFGDEVFIVHGHDDEAKVTVARFVENLGIEATILHEQANKGQTIPEKFEEHADDAGFAIILLTPDDVGAPKDETNSLKPRARQNVVLELGYFWGRLGRKRLCVLYKEGVELPSDMSGIVYVPMDNFGGWKQKLAREMNRAKLPIDPQKLL